MAIQLVHISWHKIAYRRVNGTVTTYPSQEKRTFATYQPQKEDTSVSNGIPNRTYHKLQFY